MFSSVVIFVGLGIRTCPNPGRHKAGNNDKD